MNLLLVNENKIVDIDENESLFDLLKRTYKDDYSKSTTGFRNLLTPNSQKTTELNS